MSKANKANKAKMGKAQSFKTELAALEWLKQQGVSHVTGAYISYQMIDTAISNARLFARKMDSVHVARFNESGVERLALVSSQRPIYQETPESAAARGAFVAEDHR